MFLLSCHRVTGLDSHVVSQHYFMFGLTLKRHKHHTGSFRKNGKSKTFFMGTKFHEKLIFSAFFSRELVTNLRS